MKTKTVIIIFVFLLLIVSLVGITYLISENRKKENIETTQSSSSYLVINVLNSPYTSPGGNIIKYDAKWRLTETEGELSIKHIPTSIELSIREGSGDYFCEPVECVKTDIVINNKQWVKIVDKSENGVGYIYFTYFKEETSGDDSNKMFSIETNTASENIDFEKDLDELITQLKIKD